MSVSGAKMSLIQTPTSYLILPKSARGATFTLSNTLVGDMRACKPRGVCNRLGTCAQQVAYSHILVRTNSRNSELGCAS
jgi:hypothetical protein